jgi:hypothetical protein
MKYKYPKISNTLKYKRINDLEVKVIDCVTEKEFVFSINAVRYVKKLDGHTHPYKISTPMSRKEIDDILRSLYKYDLVRKSRVRKVSFASTLLTLWMPRCTSQLKATANIYNAAIMILWLPILIAGILLFKNNSDQATLGNPWVGIIGGLALGLLLHELGHAFSGVAFGASVFEAGVVVMYFIIPGAYVLMDMFSVKNKLKRIQILLAGVEVNFLLCGLFLIFASLVHSCGRMFLFAAFSNGILGILNLTMTGGLDGMSVLSELLSTENLVDRAKSIVFDKKERRRLLHSETNGFAAVVMCYIVFAMQIALPALMALNVLEVIACFV